MKRRGYVIYAGQGDIRTYAFRVSNMGTLTPRDMEGWSTRSAPASPSWPSGSDFDFRTILPRRSVSSAAKSPQLSKLLGSQSLTPEG